MYKNISEVTIGPLKKHCTLIHYFGLGFIQVKLGPKYRIHFYTPDLPAIIGEEDVHNHRYNFTSSIFYGKFTQDIFAITEGITHALEPESCKEGIKSDLPSKICGIEKIMEQNFSEGSSYFIEHGIFHRVRTKKAITFLERGHIIKDLADVARLIDGPKVCPFSQKIPDEKLWQIVDEMLNEAKKR